MTEIEILQCFRRNGDGTWTAIKPFQITTANGSVGMARAPRSVTVLFLVDFSWLLIWMGWQRDIRGRCRLDVGNLPLK
jgi:hypothetical protein